MPAAASTVAPTATSSSSLIAGPASWRLGGIPGRGSDG